MPRHRRDDDSAEFEPTRTPKRKSNTVLWVVLACVGVVVVGCGGAGAYAIVYLRKATQEAAARAEAQMAEARRQAPLQAKGGGAPAEPVRKIVPGEVVRFGDLTVTLNKPCEGSRQFEDFSETATGYWVRIEIKNTNPNKFLQVSAQTDHAEMTDDVGNRYKAIGFERYGRPHPLRDQIAAGTMKEVRIENAVYDTVFFKQAAQGAKVVTITLSAAPYGGDGILVVEANAHQR